MLLICEWQLLKAIPSYTDCFNKQKRFVFKISHAKHLDFNLCRKIKNVSSI